ncbi:MAG: hypothetical protein HON27_15705 [Candidatus Marinimicrobia bacterium]|jgi:hypothetical protein|nr:hypothetical protein [Candidatus Neomarinimicrobiota bacterium]MBT4033222.1 hypothetical protein [Candidatus Neomarinimicrobiota bacterium]MBT4947593.1 hypothetical protein [Candidatus Neomarinimicrobiota bacterium]MBT5271516.1 hypothetical protein [Candidatus Neomarinimicrobiota bacterium]MBT6010312.1 hypothetical protein [Candidatus Neomarinimicrobiota bacterium]
MGNKIEMKISSKGTFLMMLTTIVMVVLIVQLWSLGKKPESVIAFALGLIGWGIKIIVDEHFRKISRIAEQQFSETIKKSDQQFSEMVRKSDQKFSEMERKADQQFQIIEQGIQAGYGFKQIAMQKMYEITGEIWEKAIWIAGHWNILWPGNDKEEGLRADFKTQYDEYLEFMRQNSINIPSNIYNAAGQLIKGIDNYVFGREKRDDTQADPDWRNEGHREMASASKLVSSSMKDLFAVIREEFELESLPGDILNIQVPEEEPHPIEEKQQLDSSKQ